MLKLLCKTFLRYIVFARLTLTKYVSSSKWSVALYLEIIWEIIEITGTKSAVFLQSASNQQLLIGCISKWVVRMMTIFSQNCHFSSSKLKITRWDRLLKFTLFLCCGSTPRFTLDYHHWHAPNWQFLELRKATADSFSGILLPFTVGTNTWSEPHLIAVKGKLGASWGEEHLQIGRDSRECTLRAGRQPQTVKGHLPCIDD